METVGDMYMAVSGLPDPCADHAKCIAKLALNMMDESKKVALPSGAKIQVHFSGFAEWRSNIFFCSVILSLIKYIHQSDATSESIEIIILQYNYISFEIFLKFFSYN